jgi:hypothetical protein
MSTNEESSSKKTISEHAQAVLASVPDESALNSLFGRALVLGLKVLVGEVSPKPDVEAPAEQTAAQETTAATRQAIPEAVTEPKAAPEATTAAPVVSCPSCASTSTQRGPAQNDKPAGITCVSCGHSWPSTGN